MLPSALLIVLLAPAPTVKPSPPPAIECGSYNMTWRSIKCRTHFHKDGFFACHWCGEWWHGKWRQEDGTLHVTEWPMNRPEHLTRWKVKLSGPMDGELDGGSEWKIVVLAGPGGEA